MGNDWVIGHWNLKDGLEFFGPFGSMEVAKLCLEDDISRFENGLTRLFALKDGDQSVDMGRDIYVKVQGNFRTGLSVRGPLQNRVWTKKGATNVYKVNVPSSARPNVYVIQSTNPDGSMDFVGPFRSKEQAENEVSDVERLLQGSAFVRRCRRLGDQDTRGPLRVIVWGNPTAGWKIYGPYSAHRSFEHLIPEVEDKTPSGKAFSAVLKSLGPIIEDEDDDNTRDEVCEM